MNNREIVNRVLVHALENSGMSNDKARAVAARNLDAAVAFVSLRFSRTGGIKTSLGLDQIGMDLHGWIKTAPLT